MNNLSEKALLVKLSLGIPGNSRKDRKTTEDVVFSRGLGRESGKWLKTLYPPTEYAPLVETTGKIRNWHYANSLCWQDDGWRILTTEAYLDYTQKLRELKGQFDFVKMIFLSKYDSYVEWARNEQAGTFDIGEYTGVQDVEKKFSFSINYQQLPNSGDFRVALQEEEVKAIKREMDSQSSLAIAEAMKDLWARLHKPISNMVTILNGDKKIFESLVGNVKDIVDAIPKLNLTGDAQLLAFAKEAKDLLKYDSTELKSSPSAKNEIAQRAQDIVNRMSGYFS